MNYENTKNKSRRFIFCSIIIGAIIFIYFNLEDRCYKNHGLDNKKYIKLIERLEDAYKPPITLRADAIIYQPKEDKTVRQEVIAEGRAIVPYLISGLYHKKEAIRNRCLGLLSDIPCKEGLAGLIDYLKVAPDAERIDAYPMLFQTSLHDLTGYDSIFPPSTEKGDDIEGMRKLWLPWWEENKDRIVDTETGIGLKNDDGTITPLPLKKDDDKPVDVEKEVADEKP